MSQTKPIFGDVVDPIVALNWSPYNSQLYGLQLVPTVPYNDEWYYVLTSIDCTNGVVTPILSLAADNTWVNIQWTDIDNNGNLYLLSGNENDAIGLSTKLFTFDLTMMPPSFTAVYPNNTYYTISGIHYDSKTNTLFAMSPGLVNPNNYWPHQVTTWSLVTVNPNNGDVTELYTISSGTYLNYYGGDVIKGFDAVSRILYYVLYEDELTGVIASINVDTGATTFSARIPGILPTLHNLAYIPA